MKNYLKYIHEKSVPPPKEKTIEKWIKTLHRHFTTKKNEENIFIRNVKNTSKIHWDITLHRETSKSQIAGCWLWCGETEFKALLPGKKIHTTTENNLPLSREFAN